MGRLRGEREGEGAAPGEGGARVEDDSTRAGRATPFPFFPLLDELTFLIDWSSKNGDGDGARSLGAVDGDRLPEPEGELVATLARTVRPWTMAAEVDATEDELRLLAPPPPLAALSARLRVPAELDPVVLAPTAPAAPGTTMSAASWSLLILLSMLSLRLLPFPAAVPLAPTLPPPPPPPAGARR